jgi:hypothetical protein
MWNILAFHVHYLHKTTPRGLMFIFATWDTGKPLCGGSNSSCKEKGIGSLSISQAISLLQWTYGLIVLAERISRWILMFFNGRRYTSTQILHFARLSLLFIGLLNKTSISPSRTISPNFITINWKLSFTPVQSHNEYANLPQVLPAFLYPQVYPAYFSALFSCFGSWVLIFFLLL